MKSINMFIVVIPPPENLNNKNGDIIDFQKTEKRDKNKNKKNEI